MLMCNGDPKKGHYILLEFDLNKKHIILYNTHSTQSEIHNCNQHLQLALISFDVVDKEDSYIQIITFKNKEKKNIVGWTVYHKSLGKLLHGNCGPMVCYVLQILMMKYVELYPFSDIKLSKLRNNCRTIAIDKILNGLKDFLISGEMVPLDDPKETKKKRLLKLYDTQITSFKKSWW